MKIANQIVSIILVGILLGSTIGLSVNEHYCQEDHVFTSIGIDLNPQCSCDIPMPDDCCQNISTYYALVSNYNIVQTAISSQPAYEVVEPIEYNLIATDIQPLTFNVIRDFHGPFAESKVYLMVQSFLL